MIMVLGIILPLFRISKKEGGEFWYTNEDDFTLGAAIFDLKVYFLLQGRMKG